MTARPPRSRPAFTTRRIRNQNPRHTVSYFGRLHAHLRQFVWGAAVFVLIASAVSFVPSGFLSASVLTTERAETVATELRTELALLEENRSTQQPFERRVDVQIARVQQSLVAHDAVLLSEAASPAYSDALTRAIQSPTRLLADWRQQQADAIAALDASCVDDVAYAACLTALEERDARIIRELAATEQRYRDALLVAVHTTIPQQDMTRRAAGYQELVQMRSTIRARFVTRTDAASLVYDVRRSEEAMGRYAAAHRALSQCMLHSSAACTTAERSFAATRETFEHHFEQTLRRHGAMLERDLATVHAALTTALIDAAHASCDGELRTPLASACVQVAALRSLKAEIAAELLALRSLLTRYLLVAEAQVSLAQEHDAVRALREAYAIETVLGSEWPAILATAEDAERAFADADAALERCLARATESTSCNDAARTWFLSQVSFQEAAIAAQDWYEARVREAVRTLESQQSAARVSAVPSIGSWLTAFSLGGFSLSDVGLGSINRTTIRAPASPTTSPSFDFTVQQPVTRVDNSAFSSSGFFSSLTSGVSSFVNRIGDALPSALTGAGLGAGISALLGNSPGTGALIGAAAGVVDDLIGSPIGSAVNSLLGRASGDGVTATRNAIAGCEGFELPFGISGVNVGWGGGSVSVGCVRGAVLDGPGARAGLNNFRGHYQGNTYGSAIGMITGWINFLLPFVSVIAIAALVYAGFLYLTAGVNEENVATAKKIVLYVVIGIVLIFAAYAIVNTLLSGTAQ